MSLKRTRAHKFCVTFIQFRFHIPDLINTLECDLFTNTIMQIKTGQFITSLKKQALRNQFWNKIQNNEKDSRNVMKR